MWRFRCLRAVIDKQTNEYIYSWRRVVVTKRLRFEFNNKKTQSILTVKISKDDNLKDCLQNDIEICLWNENISWQIQTSL